MKKTYENLKKKGWNEEEINHALKILKFGKSNLPNTIFHYIDKKWVYWTGLFVVIISNMFLAVLTIPLLIVMQHKIAYIFMIIFALGFGFILNILLEDIDHIDPNHHIIAGLFLPTIALINIYIVTNLTNDFIRISQINQEQYLFTIISTIYVISYMLPYTYKKIPDMVDKLDKNNNTIL